MNKLNFHGLKKNDMNLFMAVCSKVKEKGENTVVIDFDYLRKISNYTGHTIDGFLKDLRNMSLKIMAVNCEILNENGGFILFHIFNKFIADPEKATLTVTINPEFTWLLNEFTDKMKGYTTFELYEFVRLQSKYTKNLYRILKQWRTIGEFTFNSIEDFRIKLNVPESYTNKKMTQKVIKPAITEIKNLNKSFKNFKCEPLYLPKRGKPLAGYKFTWEPEKSESEANKKQKVKCSPNNNQKVPNKFANFSQRTYDYDKLEKDLLDCSKSDADSLDESQLKNMLDKMRK